jgi:ubiquitin-like protein ATG12
LPTMDKESEAKQVIEGKTQEEEKKEKESHLDKIDPKETTTTGEEESHKQKSENEEEETKEGTTTSTDTNAPDTEDVTKKIEQLIVKVAPRDEEAKNSSPSLPAPTTPLAPTKTQKTPVAADENVTPNKIEILLKAVGNAPILKKKKFLLDRTKNVHYITEWLKKFMKLDPKDSLFLYVNQEFAPSPDADIGTIYDCFRIGNTVIFHYCITPAWG